MSALTKTSDQTQFEISDLMDINESLRQLIKLQTWMRSRSVSPFQLVILEGFLDNQIDKSLFVVFEVRQDSKHIREVAREILTWRLFRNVQVDFHHVRQPMDDGESPRRSCACSLSCVFILSNSEIRRSKF